MAAAAPSEKRSTLRTPSAIPTRPAAEIDLDAYGSDVEGRGNKAESVRLPRTAEARLKLLTTANHKCSPLVALPVARTLVLGRNEKAVDVVIDSERHAAMISRRHAQIVPLPAGSGWRLEDLGTVNGLMVNGVRRKAVVLVDGDVIEFGGGGGLEEGAVSKASVSDVVYQFKTSSRKRQRDSEEAVEAAVAERAAAMRLEVERAATEKVQREMRLEVERVSAEKAQLTAALEERAQAEAQTARALHEAQAQATAHASALQQLQRDLQARDEAARAQAEEAQRLAAELAQTQRAARTTVEGEAVAERLTCPICVELLVRPVALDCGHEFCARCITLWLRTKPLCPTCRAAAPNPPKRVRALQNLADLVAEKLSEGERERYKERMAEEEHLSATTTITTPSATATAPAPARAAPARLTAAQLSPVQRLRQVVADARRRQFQFLSIRDAWTPSSAAAFTRGFAPYAHDAEARQLYCELIGLTATFVASASRAQLLRACANLRLTVAGTKEQLRSALLAFQRPPANSALIDLVDS